MSLRTILDASERFLGVRVFAGVSLGASDEDEEEDEDDEDEEEASLGAMEGGAGGRPDLRNLKSTMVRRTQTTAIKTVSSGPRSIVSRGRRVVCADRRKKKMN